MPVYQTTATLLIKDDKNSTPASELQVLLICLVPKKMWKMRWRYYSQKRLMKEVVENLHLYAPVFIAGRVTHQSAYVLSPIVVEAKYPDSLKPAKQINFTFNNRKRFVVIQSTTYPLNEWQNTPYGISSIFAKSILSSI